ncbi:phosphoadenosine phosphosulfate reductase family protein [Hansschlegelia zhihuaiae]|uniref:Phosphoadenosine phosphosulphate reductase domain-containing protein n=1 Tax=Hansschlegelia zhihuaiae TaxID=405005 RepID=A0A4Q0MF51_9HYPH|nr:phosphoadenosine phosphosulfate reductase family protein [Hansschlegelia zhihuaiae]RXF72100.1 hypothetical protein EK403_14925 [Hansschlegelia zhihuaiae]
MSAPHPAFRIEGPARVSFSGGRTSAFMLHEILRAHGGSLPDDIVVVFANTGKELPETLRFVHECATRWNVRVRWVEWRRGKPGFEEVGFNSASRDGQPFADLMAWKQRTPNWTERWCTSFLKVLPMHALMRELGYGEPGAYVETIGLRDDEGLRIIRGRVRADREGRQVAYPLARAKVTKADVLRFWAGQPFDLGLEPWEGNCDLCFATGRGVRLARLRRRPEIARWWAVEEAKYGFFDRRDRVPSLMAEAHRSPDMLEPASDEFDVECGDGCGYAEAAE